MSEWVFVLSEIRMNLFAEVYASVIANGGYSPTAINEATVALKVFDKQFNLNSSAVPFDLLFDRT